MLLLTTIVENKNIVSSNYRNANTNLFHPLLTHPTLKDLKALFQSPTKLSTEITWLGFVGLELLSDDGEVGLVCCQSQHNEIGISPTKDMLGIGVMVWLCSLTPDKVHDLVFSLTWHICI